MLQRGGYMSKYELRQTIRMLGVQLQPDAVPIPDQEVSNE